MSLLRGGDSDQYLLDFLVAASRPVLSVLVATPIQWCCAKAGVASVRIGAKRKQVPDAVDSPAERGLVQGRGSVRVHAVEGGRSFEQLIYYRALWGSES